MYAYSPYVAPIVKDLAVATGLSTSSLGIPGKVIPGSLTCYNVWLTATVFRPKIVPVMFEHVN